MGKFKSSAFVVLASHPQKKEEKNFKEKINIKTLGKAISHLRKIV